MENSEGPQWTPGPACLAVDLQPGQTSMTWREYVSRLKERVRRMAEQTNDPIQTLEESWLDLNGTCPSMAKPEKVVDSAEFLNVLEDRHGIREDDFPMQVTAQDLGDEADYPALDWWMRELIPPLSDH